MIQGVEGAEVVGHGLLVWYDKKGCTNNGYSLWKRDASLWLVLFR